MTWLVYAGSVVSFWVAVFFLFVSARHMQGKVNASDLRAGVASAVWFTLAHICHMFAHGWTREVYLSGLAAVVAVLALALWYDQTRIVRALEALESLRRQRMQPAPPPPPRPREPR